MTFDDIEITANSHGVEKLTWDSKLGLAIVIATVAVMGIAIVLILVAVLSQYGPVGSLLYIGLFIDLGLIVTLIEIAHRRKPRSD
ncbi:hypothetical protein E6H35_03175 [Candidatus Bathyarchaeota archaeon]|nr:MAG: hypothetical protein E6H35_03175 [Candidatus Bathyarchaeota archaeon]